MKASLQQRVREAIERHRMLRPGESVGVGVSGGGDSVALLLLLCDLRDILGILPLVVHFNHQLRGADSDTDEQFVARLAADRGLELISAREDVAAEARQHGWNLEDAARRLRYQFFSRVVDSGRASRVAVAHTADDQAETLLAHLIRGTGPTGLAAIYPIAGTIVRPLLEVRRQDVREYLTGLGQAWCEDRTNLDTARLRARIRHRLLPQLERDFQAGIVARLGQLAALAREDEKFWSALVENRLDALVGRPEGNLSVQIPDLLAPLGLSAAGPVAGGSGAMGALTKRLIRRIVEEVKGDRRQLTARHVDQVLHLATVCPSGHCVHLPGGIRVERNFDRLVFSLSGRANESAGEAATDGAAQTYQYVVDLEGRDAVIVSVPEIGRCFRLKVIDWPPAASDTKIDTTALDRDLLCSPLILRNWRPGDSYRPQGRQHIRKLKRLLLESRVAVRERAGWPVLTSAGALVWARGLPAAQEFAPQAGTRVGLLIREEAL